jgi:predicted RNA-binding protein with TRAM domain
MGGSMRKILLLSVAVLALGWPAIAQNAEVGKEYDITIELEDSNQYVGSYGQASVGKIVFLVPDAKKGQKYHVKVTAIANNQYTSEDQASCDFQQTGGDYKGKCIDAP